MSHLEEKPVAQMRIMPAEKPSSEIVCVVDDDPTVLRSTGLLLASDGFDVCPFNNGEDFIAYVASHDVPVVVLDIWMKGMNGLEVLARYLAADPCDCNHRTRKCRRANHRDANRHRRVFY
jgi:CheY-like chemotaxis protein